MTAKKLLPSLAKLGFLLIAAGLLFHSWHTNPPPPPPVGGGDNDEDDVKFTPTVHVSVEPIKVGTVHDYIVAYGLVEPEPAVDGKPPASAAVRVPTASLVAEVHCIEGQKVTKGQPLFTLDARYADAAIDEASKALDVAQTSCDRFEKSAKEGHVPEQWVLRAQRDRDQAKQNLAAARARKSLLTYVSPLSGTVTQLQIKPGEVADAANGTILIVDPDRLVIAANVPASRLHEIKLGQNAEIIHRQIKPVLAASDGPATQPSKTAGCVTFIDPQVDAKTGMGSVDVSIPPGTGLRLGEFAGVRIAVAEHNNCLTVPATSIVEDASGRPGISIAVREFQAAYRHPVTIGLTEDDRVEVAGPEVKAGEYVVTTGAYALPDQSRIAVSK